MSDVVSSNPQQFMRDVLSTYGIPLKEDEVDSSEIQQHMRVEKSDILMLDDESPPSLEDSNFEQILPEQELTEPLFYEELDQGYR